MRVCGPRRNDAVYDIAEAWRASGRFSDDEMQEIWEALAFLDVVAEDAGMDGWDYQPDVAPDGMVKAAVAARVLDLTRASPWRPQYAGRAERSRDSTSPGSSRGARASFAVR